MQKLLLEYILQMLCSLIVFRDLLKNTPIPLFSPQLILPIQLMRLFLERFSSFKKYFVQIGQRQSVFFSLI